MKILYSKLINLPVETENGDFLGKVADLEINIETYNVLKFYIKGSGVIRRLFGTAELIIDPSQIVSITAEKIIVKDETRKVEEKKAIKIEFKKKEEAVGVTTAERD